MAPAARLAKGQEFAIPTLAVQDQAAERLGELPRRRPKPLPPAVRAAGVGVAVPRTPCPVLRSPQRLITIPLPRPRARLGPSVLTFCRPCPLVAPQGPRPTVARQQTLLAAQAPFDATRSAAWQPILKSSSVQPLATVPDI